MRLIGSILVVVPCVALVGCSGAPEPSASPALGSTPPSGVPASPVAAASDDFSSGAGVWYANNRPGSFVARHLWAADGYIDDGPVGTSDLAVDALGRPHVAFNGLAEDEGLFYAVGPGG